MSTQKTSLFNIRQDSDGEYEKRLFEQYKLYVELADRISQRRSLANTFFVTTNSALFAVASWLQKDVGHYLYLISAVGILVSFFWFFIIRSYKQLNSGKFKVIHEIEQQLPINMFDYEWEILGNGESFKKYWPLSHVEQKIPVVFGLLYLALVLFSLCNVSGGKCIC